LRYISASNLQGIAPGGYFQASNQTAGNAMGSLKKCDKRIRLSAGRSKNHTLSGTVSKTKKSKYSRITPDETREKRVAFSEDYMLEHSHSDVNVTVIKVPAKSETVTKKLQRSAQSFGFPS
jgi:hypothetical protein